MENQTVLGLASRATTKTASIILPGDRGLKCNGSTDDTAALQAIVDAVGDYGAIILPQKPILITASIALHRGQRIMSTSGLPLADDGATGIAAPTIINHTSAYCFTYCPPPSGEFDDRYTAPIIEGLRFWADNGVMFGNEDDIVSYFLADGWVRRCMFTPQSALGGTAINLIENYRGGAEHNWIKGFATGIRDKSSDVSTIRNNRTWNCTVHIDLLAPATTGTQRVVTHNDMLQSASAYVAGQTYLIRTEDSWVTITDNYMESSGTGSSLCADAVVKLNTPPARPLDHVTFKRNRVEFNNAQAAYIADFGEGMPDALNWENNTTRKGPTPISAVNWPSRPTVWAHQYGKRMIQFSDQRVAAPWVSRDFSNQGDAFVIDAGTGIGTQLGPSTSLWVHDQGCLSFAYTGQNQYGSSPGLELWTSHPDLAAMGSLAWDIEVVVYADTPGMTFWAQPRHGNVSPPTFVDEYDLTLTTLPQVLTIKNVTRTALTMFCGVKGATQGTVFVKTITARPARPALAPYNSVSASANLIAGNRYAADTTAGSVTLTLPALSGLSAGAAVEVADVGGASETHNITIAAAGADPINGLATNPITFARNLGSVRLVVNASATSWQAVF